MKLLGISAGRPMSNCELLLKHALQGAEEAGCEVELLRLQDYRIEPCNGCTRCINRKLSGLQSGCSIPDDADDYATYARAVMEADGFVLAAPCYNLTVAGRMLDALNRKHCFMSQLKERCKERPKYAATIGVGGTDWTNFLMPVLNFAATEHCGGKMNLVDQMLVEFEPAVASVALAGETVERARQLGHSLAKVVLGQSEKIYLGDAEEVCPICHGSHLQLRGGKVICPTCDITGHVSEEDGKLPVTWEQGFEQSRWSEYGDNLHLDGIRAGHRRAMEHREEIRLACDALQDYLQPIQPARPEQ